MKTLIITGGVACGKSSCTSMLGNLLGHWSLYFSADHAVCDQLSNASVQDQLRRIFGSGVLLSSGGIDRSLLREIAMAEPLLRKQLEDLLHPRVLDSLQKARDSANLSGRNLFLAEIPLHYEIGSTVSADLVIVVASSRSVQVRRMMETRGLGEQTANQFLDAQWPIEAKVERADVVIWNDGSLASLEAQVLTLARTLLQA